MPIAKVELRALILAGITIAALIALSAGISTLTLEPGRAILISQPEYIPPPRLGPLPGSGDFLLRMVAVLLLLLPISFIYLLFSPEARKRLFIQLLQISIIIAFFYFLFTRSRTESEGEKGWLSGFFNLSLPGDLMAEPYTGQAPSWLVDVLSYGIVVLILLILAAVFWLWRRMLASQRMDESAVRQDILRSAQLALDELRNGANFYNVILRCYQEMNQIAAERRSVQRKNYLTPREFIEHLQQAGLPGEQVERLTLLFEAVRYGAQEPTPSQEAEAISCLSAIVQDVGGAV